MNFLRASHIKAHIFMKSNKILTATNNGPAAIIPLFIFMYLQIVYRLLALCCGRYATTLRYRRSWLPTWRRRSKTKRIRWKWRRPGFTLASTDRTSTCVVTPLSMGELDFTLSIYPLSMQPVTHGQLGLVGNCYFHECLCKEDSIVLYSISCSIFLIINWPFF